MIEFRKVAYIFIILASTVLLLVFARGILLPFVIALFVWLIIRSIRNYLLKIGFVRKYIPIWILNIIATLLITSVSFIFGTMLLQNLAQLTEVLPEYQQNLRNTIDNLNNVFGSSFLEQLKDWARNINLNWFFQGAVLTFSGFLSTFAMVLVYVLFLLIEENCWGVKIGKLFYSSEGQKRAVKITEQLSSSVESYILIKTVISFLTGLLSYFVLIYFQIDFAFFWAFLIFVTSYIPNIGAFVGMIFPSVFVLFQTGNFQVFLIILAIFGAIQFVMGNVLEPKWMGTSMNLSTLVVLLSLAIWGAIWGVMGMILSVPLTMILTIIMAQFPETKKISVLLSEKGR